MEEHPDDPAWRHYADTILHFDGGAVIDLRRPLGAAELDALRGMGFDGTFAVVTACDPRGRTASAAQNATRHAAMLAGLRLRDPACRVATGASPDGEHREPGVAVRMPLNSARDVARRYEQSAFFWFDGTAFTIHGAMLDTPPIPLPVPD